MLTGTPHEGSDLAAEGNPLESKKTRGGVGGEAKFMTLFGLEEAYSLQRLSSKNRLNHLTRSGINARDPFADKGVIP